MTTQLLKDTFRLVRTTKLYMRPYWLADISAIVSKYLAMRLLPIYEKQEQLYRDTRSSVVDLSNELHCTRKEVTDLRKLLEEKHVLDRFEGYIKIREDDEEAAIGGGRELLSGGTGE